MLDPSSITLPTPTGECAKSRNYSDKSEGLLPPFLHNTEPLTDSEDMALQLALVTMEVASIRSKLAGLSELLSRMAMLISPDSFLGDFL